MKRKTKYSRLPGVGCVDTIPHSSPEQPLTIPETMDYPVGVHYFQVPNPRGLTLYEMRYEFSHPSPGRSVVVEMTVSQPPELRRLRWEFRYIWASWSLVVEFSGGGEKWQLLASGAGPRTENQVRELYELADDFSIRESATPLHWKWTQVKRAVLPQNWRKTELGDEATKQKKIEELEDRVILDLQLLAARSHRTWHKNADSETTVLQSFLQGRTSASLLCNLFDLDWKSCVPVLQGLQEAYARLISKALGQRCWAVCNAHAKKKVTLKEAADLLFSDAPIAEDILRIGSVVQRKFTPANHPSKKQLMDAIHAVESLKLTGSGGTGNQPHEKTDMDKKASGRKV